MLVPETADTKACVFVFLAAVKSLCGFMFLFVLEDQHHSVHYFEIASMNASALLASRGHFVLFRCAEAVVGLSFYRSKLEARLQSFPFLNESCYLGCKSL